MTNETDIPEYVTAKRHGMNSMRRLAADRMVLTASMFTMVTLGRG